MGTLKLETRTFRNVKMLCLVCENELESRMVDDSLGAEVGEDGLIARVSGEVRLADGYGEHYICLKACEEDLIQL